MEQEKEQDAGTRRRGCRAECTSPRPPQMSIIFEDDESAQNCSAASLAGDVERGEDMSERPWGCVGIRDVESRVEGVGTGTVTFEGTRQEDAVPMVSTPPPPPPVLTARTASIVCRGISFGGPTSANTRTIAVYRATF